MFNTSSWRRKELVFVPVDNQLDDRLLKQPMNGREDIAVLVDVMSMSYSVVNENVLCDDCAYIHEVCIFYRLGILLGY